jgi:hypothetical protein
MWNGRGQTHVRNVDWECIWREILQVRMMEGKNGVALQKEVPHEQSIIPIVK